MSIAILPAAGRSSRMGRPKLLLPFGGKTIVGSLVAALSRAGVDRVVLVTAPDDEEIGPWAAGHDVEVAVNPRPERGMLSTIVAGLHHLGGATSVAQAGQTLLVSPADIPSIRAATVRALLDAFERSPEPLAVPIYRGKRGHPLLISAALVEAIPGLDADVGLKQLRDLGHPLLEHPVDDPGVVSDVDTPADYERLRASTKVG